jgi:predicted RNA-binding Zn ribbon-like protein
MMLPASSISDHDLLGGRLALDFANTVEPRTGPGQRDYLPDYRALADWSAHSRAVSAAEAADLRSAAAADPERAAAVWREAIAMREAVYRLVLAVTEKRAPSSADLAVVSKAFRRAQQHAMLAVVAGKVRWSWDSALDLERPLWDVASSAVDVLTTDDVSRLGVCSHGADGCGWVFLDTTKNRSRRWCGMADCGARAKARRLTERRRRARSYARAQLSPPTPPATP